MTSRDANPAVRQGWSGEGLWAPLVAVLGASGGVGASTWAAALARRLSLHLGECVLVDGHFGGGGLDMSCGTEHLPGLRWSDLTRLRGVASCERLVRALPAGEVPVLSTDGRGGVIPDAVVADVLESLRGAVAVVVDVDRGSVVGESIVAAADQVQVVSGLGVRQVADAQAVLIRLAGVRAAHEASHGASHGEGANGRAGVGLLTRGGRSRDGGVDELAEQLGVRHLAHLRDDAKVRRDGERGEWPGMRGALRDTADRVVLDLLEGEREHRGRRPDQEGAA